MLRDRRQTDETETCTKKEYIETIILEMKEFER
jgi:hypothetical protein